jgi:hypothetical protein
MRKTTREEKISRPAVYEVPSEGVQFMSISVDDYLKLSDDLATAQMLIRELGNRLAKLEKPWVGLTQVELELLCDEWRIIYGAYVEEFAKDIEKKIKEKNGA